MTATEAQIAHLTDTVWQQGQWADAPRRADRIQERLANAQHVTGWLRARAATLRAETRGEGGAGT